MPEVDSKRKTEEEDGSESDSSGSEEPTVLARMLRRKDKKDRKKRQKKIAEDRGTKDDYASVFGDARPELEYLERVDMDLKGKDVQCLILYTLQYPVMSRRILMKHKALVEGVIMVVVEGLTLSVFNEYKRFLPCLDSLHFNNSTKVPLQQPFSVHNPFIALKHVLHCPVNIIPDYKKHSKRIGSIMLDTGVHHARGGGYNKNPTLSQNTTYNPNQKLPPLKSFRKEICGQVSYSLSKFPGAVRLLAKQQDLQEAKYPQIGHVEIGRPEELVEAGHPTVVAPPATYYTLLEDRDITLGCTVGSICKYIPTYVHEGVKSAQCMDNLVSDSQQISLQRGIDCEMVETENGKELARVTVLNWDGGVLLDKFVWPEHTVTDWLTQYSGCSEEILQKNNPLTFIEARKAVLSLLSAHMILVGHSLENDLHVMRIIHERVLDTALLYPHFGGPHLKQSQRGLAKKHLNQDIQTDYNGHDSIEDALVALKLVYMKLLHGPDYGINTNHVESQFTILDTEPKCKHTMISSGFILKRYTQPNTNSILAETDSVAAKQVSKVHQSGLTVVHLRELGMHMNGIVERVVQPPVVVVADLATPAGVVVTNTTEEPKTEVPISKDDIPTLLIDDVTPFCEQKCKALDKNIRDIYKSTPPNTLVCIVSGQGSSYVVKKNTDRMEKLRTCINAFGNILQVDGTTVNLINEIGRLDTMNKDLISKNERGICVLGIKQ